MKDEGGRMRALFPFFCAFALLSFAPAHGQQTPVAVGQQAPDFTLTDQDGQKRSLSAERGKRPVVLVFYRGYW